ncbi:MAG: MauE/DoxX family redox-associated membrane protein, partial [Alphaproteobacteria bacterium]
MPAIDPAILAALRLALALLLLRAALHKLRDREAFRDALSGYALLPAAVGPAVARVLPALELAAAVLLVLPPTARAGAVLAGALLLVYSAAIATALARGRADAACGCGGPAGELGLSGGLLVRNAILLCVATACAAATAARAPSWIDAVTVVGGVAV